MAHAIMSTTTKDMNKTATQAPRGVERAKAWFISGPMSGPMVPPYERDECHQRTNDDPDPQAIAAGQGVAAADAQQSDDDSPPPNPYLMRSSNWGIMALIKSSGDQISQRRPRVMPV